MFRIKLFLSVVFLATTLMLCAQNERDVLTLTNFKIEVDGSEIDFDTTINVVLVKDVLNDILIYKSDQLSYYAEFTYKHKGRRAKLVRHTYALLTDGKKVYSKRKKDMQELKVSVPGMIKGKSAESILYNKSLMRSIFVSFNYVYNYKM